MRAIICDQCKEIIATNPDDPDDVPMLVLYNQPGGDSAEPIHLCCYQCVEGWAREMAEVAANLPQVTFAFGPNSGPFALGLPVAVPNFPRHE